VLWQRVVLQRQPQQLLHVVDAGRNLHTMSGQQGITYAAPWERRGADRTSRNRLA
jgi:hypothetical protein